MPPAPGISRSITNLGIGVVPPIHPKDSPAIRKTAVGSINYLGTGAMACTTSPMTFSDTSVIITIISLLENRKINEKQNYLCSFAVYRSGCAGGRRPDANGPHRPGLRPCGKNALVQHRPARRPQRRAADVFAGREVLV